MIVLLAILLRVAVARDDRSNKATEMIFVRIHTKPAAFLCFFEQATLRYVSVPERKTRLPCRGEVAKLNRVNADQKGVRRGLRK
jgi:hypothetical protein